MAYAGITEDSLAQPPLQLVVGDGDAAFTSSAESLTPLVNVTVVQAPANSAASRFAHSALCYARALEICSQHARQAFWQLYKGVNMRVSIGSLTCQ